MALAVGLGVLVGASPLLGLHVWIVLALGTLFGLNRLTMYLASNISNPLFAPFLYAAELQLGYWLLHGEALGFSPLRGADLHSQVRAGFAACLVGGLVIGAALGGAAGLATWWGARRMRARETPEARQLRADEGRFDRAVQAVEQLHRAGPGSVPLRWFRAARAGARLRLDPIYRLLASTLPVGAVHQVGAEPADLGRLLQQLYPERALPGPRPGAPVVLLIDALAGVAADERLERVRDVARQLPAGGRLYHRERSRGGPAPDQLRALWRDEGLEAEERSVDGGTPFAHVLWVVSRPGAG